MINPAHSRAAARVDHNPSGSIRRLQEAGRQMRGLLFPFGNEIFTTNFMGRQWATNRTLFRRPVPHRVVLNRCLDAKFHSAWTCGRSSEHILSHSSLIDGMTSHERGVGHVVCREAQAKISPADDEPELKNSCETQVLSVGTRKAV